MVQKTLIFRRSTPLHGDSSCDHRNTSTPNNTTNTPGNRSNQYTSNGYHGSNSNGYYGSSRGRGGHRFNNQEGEMSAARHLHQQIGHINEHVHVKPRYGSLPVYPASAASTSHQSSDKQESISEPATIIWCEGGIGEVMSPCVWRHPNLHLYFHSEATKMEGKDGWRGLKTELEPGMEMDVSFSLPQSLLHELELAAVQDAEDKHTFICIDTILELRASRCSSVRTHEQTVVIAQRKGGVAFLMNNAGERTVLHPNFLPLDAVRHAIIEQARGQKQIPIAEIDSPSSLFVLGRSLAVRLTPAPAWLPNIYPSDRGVTRWALSAEPYGEEKHGRAIVIKWTRHSITLCPVEGDLKGKKTSLHAPCIQMPLDLKKEAQEVGTCWWFRACRELPGRSAVWRAFEIIADMGLDDPIPEAEIESILMTDRLINMDQEEEKEQERRPTVLDDLAQLFPQPAAAAASSAVAAEESMQIPVEEDDVLVFDSIDDMLDSSTFVADVFKAPSILPGEWMLLGVPPEEAIKTEQEMLLADVPRVMPTERTFGVYRTGDERPDMRVQPKKKMKRKSRRLVESIASASDEDAEPQRERAAEATPPRAPSNSLVNNEESESTVRQTDEKDAKERKREMKEDSRHKKHLATIAVKYATGSDDFFDLLHGDVESVEAAAATSTTTAARDEQQLRPEGRTPPPPDPHPPAATGSPLPAATAAPPAARAAAAAASSMLLAAGAPGAPSSSVRFATSGDDLFDLFHGPAVVVAARSEQGPSAAAVAAVPSVVARAAPPAAAARTVVARAESPTVAAAPTLPVVARAAPHPAAAAAVEEPRGRPRAPRFSILPYPERPRHADGWWFLRTRPLVPVESNKERRRRRRDEEDRRMRDDESEEDSDAAPDGEDEAPAAPERNASPVPVRRPSDNLRATMLAALKKKGEQKQVTPLSIVATTLEKKEEEKEEVAEENVLVDLSPVIASPSTLSSSADSAPFLHPPKELRYDLKDDPLEGSSVPVRRPTDNLRATMLAAFRKKDEQKQVAPLSIVTTLEKKEEGKEEVAEENVLVDLSPVIASPSSLTSSAAPSDSAPFLHPPKELHDDLKDLF